MPTGETTAAVPQPQASSSAPVFAASASSSRLARGAPDAQQLEDALAGNARENGAVEHRGADDAVDLEHDVHGADFFDILALHAVKPEDLGKALFLGAVAGAAELLSWSAVSIIFYSRSTVMNGVLQGSGHPSIPVRNAAIALAVNAIVAAVMVGPLNLHIYGIVFAMVLYSFVVLILNMLAIRKHIGYLPDFRALLIPVKAALVMGAVVAVIYWVPTLLIPSVFERYIGSALLLVLAVLAGIATYFAIYGRITDLTDEEIRRLPMGTKILSLMRKLHVR